MSVAAAEGPDYGTWDVSDITSDPVGLWEPAYDSALWERDNILHLYVHRVGQGDAETLEDVPPQTVNVIEWRP